MTTDPTWDDRVIYGLLNAVTWDDRVIYGLLNAVISDNATV